MLDMLSIITQQSPILGQYSMKGVYDVIEDHGNYGFVYHVKNDQGFPLDFMYYDQLGVYDSGTEFDKEGWTDPSSVKLSLANDTRGRKMCPRFIESGFPVITDNYSSPYLQCKGGKVSRVLHNVGQTRYTWSHPYMSDWSGDVGLAMTYMKQYQWGGDTSGVYDNLEAYYYVPPFGMIKWEHYNLNKKTGLYDLDQSPAPNNIKRPLKNKPPLVVYPISL